MEIAYELGNIPWILTSIRICGIWMKRKDFSAREWSKLIRVAKPYHYQLGSKCSIIAHDGERETKNFRRLDKTLTNPVKTLTW